MKTKPVTLQVNVPDNGKPYSLCVVLTDITPVSLNDFDRLRELTRQVWVVDAGSTEARPAR